jgi:hypothetical protein
VLLWTYQVTLYVAANDTFPPCALPPGTGPSPSPPPPKGASASLAAKAVASAIVSSGPIVISPGGSTGCSGGFDSSLLLALASQQLVVSDPR